MKVFIKVFLSVGVILFVLLLGLLSCKREANVVTGEKASYGLPIPQAEYVGRELCKACHEKEYTLFQGSDHDEAMDHANETTVLGDFNMVTVAEVEKLMAGDTSGRVSR